MPSAAPISEGFVPFRGFRTWYRVVGDLAQPGGPAKLPQEAQETLRHHEEAGTTEEVAYEEAMQVYDQRHVCRLDPWPEPLTRTSVNPEVSHKMWGPSEFYVTGTLREWDIRHRLGEIQLPILVTSGRYDAATPAIAETVHRGIAGSEGVIFERS